VHRELFEANPRCLKLVSRICAEAVAAWSNREGTTSRALERPARISGQKGGETHGNKWTQSRLIRRRSCTPAS
jgi:hypothetical protein